MFDNKIIKIHLNKIFSKLTNLKYKFNTSVNIHSLSNLRKKIEKFE